MKTLRQILKLNKPVEEDNIKRGPRGFPGKIPSVKYLLDLIKPLIPEVEDGHTPTDEELLKIIEPLIPKVKNGITPTKSELLDLIRPLIPVVKNGHTPTKEEILSVATPILLQMQKEISATVKESSKKLIENNLSDSEKRLLKILRQEMSKIAQAMDRIGGGGLSRTAVIELLTGLSARDDLSDQLDGATRVFSIKESYVSGSVTLHGTEFPGTYRPVTDFTESADKEITIDVTLPAPESGHTLYVRYEKQIT